MSLKSLLAVFTVAAATTGCIATVTTPGVIIRGGPVVHQPDHRHDRHHRHDHDRGHHHGHHHPGHHRH